MAYETDLEIYLPYVAKSISKQWIDYTKENITMDEFLYYLKGIWDSASFVREDLDYLMDFIIISGYDIMQYEDDVAYLPDDDNDGEVDGIPTFDPAHAQYYNDPNDAPPAVARENTINEEYIITLRNAMDRADLRQVEAARPAPTIQVRPGRRRRT